MVTLMAKRYKLLPGGKILHIQSNSTLLDNADLIKRAQQEASINEPELVDLIRSPQFVNSLETRSLANAAKELGLAEHLFIGRRNKNPTRKAGETLNITPADMAAKSAPKLRPAAERMAANQPKQMTITPNRQPIKRAQNTTPIRRGNAPIMNRMDTALSREMQLASDPVIRKAIQDVYGFDFQPERDLIPWDTWENKQLQRAGVDFITPDGLKIDLKGRSPVNKYEDIPLELISQEYGGLNFASHGRGANNIHTRARRGIDDRPLDGAELSRLLENMDPRNKIGWTIDPKKETDQLIYSNPGIGRVSIIDAPALRDRTFDLVDAQYEANKQASGFNKPFYSVWQNPTYNTINLPVSYDVLERVLGNKIRNV